MDMITAAYAANKAKADLENSGQVGYMGVTQDVVVSQVTVTKSLQDYRGLPVKQKLREGETYFVNYDGVEYSCKCKYYFDSGNNTPYLYIGDFFEYWRLYLDEDFGESTGEPFTLYDEEGLLVVLGCIDGGTHTISVYQKTETPVPIDPKFIPDMDSITLNGADGKQYRVTVGANGTLTATAI